MRMQKKQFRIGELAKKLNLERFVIRFWEKEFSIKSTRSHGGQRFYTEQDVNLFYKIKTLLYEQGFTIAGAKKHFDAKAIKSNKIIGSQVTDMKGFNTTQKESERNTVALKKEIVSLKKQLLKLKDLLAH